jgi:membrane protease YdiL (CAAX protease family)
MSPSARRALGALLGVIALALVPATALVVAAIGGGVEGSALGTLTLESALGLFALAGALLSRRPVVARLCLGPSRLDWLSLLILLVGMLALSHALDGLMGWTGLRERSALANFGSLLEGAHGRAAFTIVVGFAFAPAVAEELLCRGLVQNGLVARAGPTVAILTASLVFGAIHLEPIHGTFAAILGLYLGTVAHWGGSIRPTIFCHLVNNLAAVALPVHAPRISIALALVLTAGCLWLAWRRQRREGVPMPLEASRGIAERMPEDPTEVGIALQPDEHSDDR